MKIHSFVPRIYNPSVFQGRKKPSKYFEGWYFKLVDKTGDHIWSVIPGVSFSADSHSFVQVIHANSGKTYYQRYPVNAFSGSRKEFNIQVGPNSFSDRMLSLDIVSDNLVAKGELTLNGIHPFPVKLLSPGIMGWYAFVPFMECYHGVVSMQHELNGTLELNGSGICFDGGKGYIEKDWGTSMPSDWIWMQSNHFKHNMDASFMLSVARIPWLKGFFPGFLSFLKWEDKVYRFATYNHSVVEHLEVTEKDVTIKLRNKKYQLEVKVLRQDGGVLKAPRQGSMDRTITESIISSLLLVLKSHDGKILYRDTGRYAGLEIVGDMEQYYKNID